MLNNHRKSFINDLILEIKNNYNYLETNLEINFFVIET